jgi:hypothetical protein
VTGEKESSSFGSTDVYLLKIDADGDTLWTRRFGESNTSEIGRSVVQTSDGGYAIGGYAGVGQDNEVYLLKTDADGNFEWDAFFGPTPDNRGHGIIQSSDGGYVIAGQAYVAHGAFGSYDMFVVKTDAQGGLEWQRFIGDDMNDFALSVCEAANGDFVVAGSTMSFGVWDAYLARLSPTGDSVWAQHVGRPAADEACDILALPDGSGFVFTGITVAPSRGDGDVYLARTDTEGNILWSETYGGTDDDNGQSLVQMADGGFVISAMSASFGDFGWNVYVIKTDSVGAEEWSRVFGDEGDDRGHGVARGSDGSIAVAGWTSSYGAGWLDVYLIKFEPDQGMGVGVEWAIMPRNVAIEQNYPNPFNASTRIEYIVSVGTNVTIDIFDLLGRRVATLVDSYHAPGRYDISWDAGKFSSGIYSYRIQGHGLVESRRMALLK